MMKNKGKLALITRASSGYGLELARMCGQDGFDLIVCDPGPEIARAGAELRYFGGQVTALQVDIATAEGVNRLCKATEGRHVDAMLINAPTAVSGPFFDGKFEDAVRIINTGVTGALYLLYTIGRQMMARGEGKVLLAAALPEGLATPSAASDGAATFLEIFFAALQEEIRGRGVQISHVVPHELNTARFKYDDVLEAEWGSSAKDAVWRAAKATYDALINGEEAHFVDMPSATRHSDWVAAAH